MVWTLISFYLKLRIMKLNSSEWQVTRPPEIRNTFSNFDGVCLTCGYKLTSPNQTPEWLGFYRSWPRSNVLFAQFLLSSNRCDRSSNISIFWQSTIRFNEVKQLKDDLIRLRIMFKLKLQQPNLSGSAYSFEHPSTIFYQTLLKFCRIQQ
jgi:hypothetical protein